MFELQSKMGWEGDLPRTDYGFHFTNPWRVAGGTGGKSTGQKHGTDVTHESTNTRPASSNLITIPICQSWKKYFDGPEA